MLELAFAYVGAGDARRAVSIFEKVAKDDPGNLAAWMNIGLLYHEKLGSKAKAKKAYKQYLAHGGKDKRVSRWLHELDE